MVAEENQDKMKKKKGGDNGSLELEIVNNDIRIIKVSF